MEETTSCCRRPCYLWSCSLASQLACTLVVAIGILLLSLWKRGMQPLILVVCWRTWRLTGWTYCLSPTISHESCVANPGAQAVFGTHRRGTWTRGAPIRFSRVVAMFCLSSSFPRHHAHQTEQHPCDNMQIKKFGCFWLVGTCLHNTARTRTTSSTHALCLKSRENVVFHLMTCVRRLPTSSLRWAPPVERRWRSARFLSWGQMEERTLRDCFFLGENRKERDHRRKWWCCSRRGAKNWMRPLAKVDKLALRTMKWTTTGEERRIREKRGKQDATSNTCEHWLIVSWR